MSSVNGKFLNAIGTTRTFADFFPLTVKLGRGNPFPWARVPSAWVYGVLSSVLQISKLVKPETGVIRGSEESRFLVSVFCPGEIVAEDVGAGAAFLTATPLFQTSLLPDFMQVNFFPPAVAVTPALVHFAPALTAANDGPLTREMHITRAIKTRDRVMTQM